MKKTIVNKARFQNAVCVFLLAGIGGVVFGRAAVAQQSPGIEVQECVVQFAAEVDVPALETGRVAELHVKKNQSVTEEGPILRLAGQSLLIRRKAAQVRLVSAQKEASSAIELDFAGAALEEARAELDLNLRIEKDTGGAVTRERVRQLRIGLKRAELEVARAQQRIDQALVAVELQQSEIAGLDDQLQRLHIGSPLTGIVLDVAKSKGEWVQQGQTVATVARVDRLHVYAFIRSQQIAASDCVGLPVSVSWTNPGTLREQSLPGKVISVNPQRLPGSRFRIQAEIVNQPKLKDKQHWQLHPGTEVRMIVHTGSIAKRTTGSATNR